MQHANIKAIINGHNKRILATTNAENNLRECNCRRPADCPLSGKCLTPSVVYQATLTTSDNNKIENYVGLTGETLKHVTIITTTKCSRTG